jgi:hypothetical protein
MPAIRPSGPQKLETVQALTMPIPAWASARSNPRMALSALVNSGTVGRSAVTTNGTATYPPLSR